MAASPPLGALAFGTLGTTAVPVDESHSLPVATMHAAVPDTPLASTATAIEGRSRPTWTGRFG